MEVTYFYIMLSSLCGTHNQHMPGHSPVGFPGAVRVEIPLPVIGGGRAYAGLKIRKEIW